MPPASDDTTMRLLDLYHHTDPELARVLEARVGLAAMARDGGMDAMTPTDGNRPTATGFAAQVRAYFAEAAGTAAKFLARPDGPRVGALAFNGWDTHINEGADRRPARDTARRARRRARGGRERAWARPGARPWSRSSPSSAAPRASTAPTAPTTAPARSRCLLGGALKGGRVIADWPGLKNADLYEGRDLKATTDLRAVLKGLLQDHLRVDRRGARRRRVPGQRGGQADGRIAALGVSGR